MYNCYLLSTIFQDKLLINCSAKNSKWLEITDKFLSASSTLAPGLLIHTPAFNLFDAMSAIEIADSKMDAVVQWYMLPSHYPHSLKEALDKQLLKLEGHTHSELIGIFDELLACMATWLKGHTLAQTVFTCMYVLDPSQFENPILCGFAMATIRVVDMFRDVITRGRVCVEDEPHMICAGLNMRCAMEDSTVLSTLKLAQGRISAYTSETIKEDIKQALSSRIKFIESIFQFCIQLKKRTRDSSTSAEQSLSDALNQLQTIASSLDLGEELDASDPLKLGFHPLINQHNLPPSCRPYGILPRSKAVTLLTSSLEDIQKMFVIGRLSSLSDIVSYLSGLCSVQNSPDVLSRSFIACYSLDNDRTKSFATRTIEEMVKEDIRSLYNPPCLNPRSPVSTTALCKDLLERFLGHAHLPLTNLFKVYCHHRARQRNMIGRYLKSVGDLQAELELIDQQLNELTAKIDPQRQHNSSFSSWLVYFVSQLFIDYLHLGFEYNLYSPFEYHYILWYLEYLYGWKQMVIKSAGKQLQQEPNPAGKNKKKSKVKKKELPKEKEAELAILEVKRMICIGLMRTCEALMLDGNRVPTPSSQFSAESLIFYNRFLPFTSVLSPHPLTYLDYQQLAGIRNYKNTTLNLYSAAFKHYNNTKATLELMQGVGMDPEVGQLLKVVKTNLVIMKLASSGHKGNAKQLPQLDFTLHKNFPVIRL